LNVRPDAAISAPPDALSLRRWFLLYGAYLLALAVPAGLLLRDVPSGWKDLFVHPGQYTLPAQQALKLLIFGLYLSVCTTFVPLPTSWLVSGVATANVALSPNILVTTLLVATVGAVSSTLANGSDFHLFSWLLRHHRVAKVRQTALSRRAGEWFARRPFWLLVVFNIIPIPVDVVRMLAAMHQYPFRPFLAANFVGRFIRYAVIAVVTFELRDKGWIAPLALLGVAAVLGISKVARTLLERRGGGDPGDTAIG